MLFFLITLESHDVIKFDVRFKKIKLADAPVRDQIKKDSNTLIVWLFLYKNMIILQFITVIKLHELHQKLQSCAK